MRLLAIRRMWRILCVVIRYQIDDLLFDVSMVWWMRALSYLLPWRWLPRSARSQTKGVRLRLALESLGPIFIKFGQLLSTRRDLLPLEIADELARLQDQVPPFDSQRAMAQIEQQLGLPLAEAFASIDTEPLASASIAQVYAATLHSGQEVVVKVIRPGLRPIIQQDIAWLFALARLAQRLSKDARRLRLVEVISDYERTILDELDLLREAANTSQLRRNFAGSPLLYVPQVYWEWCRPQVLVLERIYGIPVNDLAQLASQKVNMRILAERGVEIFFTQVFRDSFFHADMHPGNIFVNAHTPQSPQYIAIDCGIIGSLTPEDQDYLARNLMAFFKRDYRKVAQLHIDSGWVSANTRLDALESAIRTVCEPIFEKPLKDISFGQVLLRLFETARRFDMVVQPQLVLLQKTLVHIEGLGRELYPELDLWNTAQPFLERRMRDKVNPLQLLRSLQLQAEQVPHLSQRAKDTLERLRLPAPTLTRRTLIDYWPERLLGIALIAGALSQHPLSWPYSWSAALLLLGGTVLILRR